MTVHEFQLIPINSVAIIQQITSKNVDVMPMSMPNPLNIKSYISRNEVQAISDATQSRMQQLISQMQVQNQNAAVWSKMAQNTTSLYNKYPKG